MKHIITITITLFFFNSFGQTMPREMNDFFADLGYYPYDQKLEKIDSAIQKNPNESWYYFMRASVYESMGRIEEAGDTYRKVVELNPNDGGSYATLARYYHDHDSTKMDEALRLINKALEMDTTDWYFNVHRGFIYMALKQYENALKDADYLFSLEGVDYMPVTELVVKIFLAMDRKDALKGFMTQYPLTDLGGYMDTKFDILVGDLYKEFGMMDNACLSYQFAADPYLFMDEEVPAYILALLSECNTPYTIKRVPNKDNYYEGNIIAVSYTHLTLPTTPYV